MVLCEKLKEGAYDERSSEAPQRRKEKTSPVAQRAQGKETGKKIGQTGETLVLPYFFLDSHRALSYSGDVYTLA